MDDEF
jgi:serine/threonine protein kinase